ncbi:MAG: phosphoribosylformylglycinamidine synthase subunit PurQ, partial [Dehalococcoidales bacterium]|nr:phosphoribosylformylglycinamidine synthase subunit PurQ [Dehalococcoidales bacterium]
TLQTIDAALFYIDSSGNQPAAYPDDPSGSLNGIAGICDETGRIFALMPHPERHISPHQHPGWTRGQSHDPGDGLKIFTNAVGWIKQL